MSFKSFILIYMVIVAGFSGIIGMVYRIKSPDNQATKPHHFSVVWKGFNPNNPAYSNETADYYICINDLQASVLQMHMAFQIQNNENYSFWFMIDQYQTPPTGWNITSYCIGTVPVDTSTTFVYSNLARVKPSSIPSGTTTETIALVVKAYYDSLYTQFYSQDNFTVQFHFIDRTASVWTTLQYNNFDDGTAQGWTGPYAGIISSPDSRYRSYPCSFATGGLRGYWGYNLDKTFDTTGPFTEVYLIFALWHSGGDDMSIYINGVMVFKPDLNTGITTWYQYVIPLPRSASVGLSIQNVNACLDDVYVIAE